MTKWGKLKNFSIVLLWPDHIAAYRCRNTFIYQTTTLWLQASNNRQNCNNLQLFLLIKRKFGGISKFVVTQNIFCFIGLRIFRPPHWSSSGGISFFFFFPISFLWFKWTRSILSLFQLSFFRNKLNDAVSDKMHVWMNATAHAHYVS